MFQAINDLLTQNLGFFDAMGQNLFRAFATILIVWYGVKSALSSAGGRHMFHFDNFASLLLTISFGFAMVNYYSTPIPGIGTSFHNLITDESQFLANKINQTELQTVEERIADFETRMDSPGIADVLGTAMYVVVIILLAAAQAIAIVVIAYRIYRYRCLCSCGARFHTVLYRPEIGVAVLGLVSLFHPIRVLPGHRRCGCLRHCKSDSRNHGPSAEGHDFDGPAH